MRLWRLQVAAGVPGPGRSTSSDNCLLGVRVVGKVPEAAAAPGCWVQQRMGLQEGRCRVSEGLVASVASRCRSARPGDAASPQAPACWMSRERGARGWSPPPSMVAGCRHPPPAAAKTSEHRRGGGGLLCTDTGRERMSGEKIPPARPHLAHPSLARPRRPLGQRRCGRCVGPEQDSLGACLPGPPGPLCQGHGARSSLAAHFLLGGRAHLFGAGSLV